MGAGLRCDESRVLLAVVQSRVRVVVPVGGAGAAAAAHRVSRQQLLQDLAQAALVGVMMRCGGVMVRGLGLRMVLLRALRRVVRHSSDCLGPQDLGRGLAG